MITCKVTGTTRTHAGAKTPITTMHFDAEEDICYWSGSELSVSTTGYVGGDTAYTEIKFTPNYGINFMLNIPGRYESDSLVGEFSVITYGDWEIDALKNMFKCALQGLNALTEGGLSDTTGWSIERWYGEGGDIYMTTNPTVQDCYKEYCDYCAGLHFKPVSKQKFSRQICSHHPFKSIPYKGDDGRSVRRYFNIQDDSMNSMRIKHTANK